MKKKFKKSMIILLVLCLLSYGYFIYRSNFDNLSTNPLDNRPHYLLGENTQGDNPANEEPFEGESADENNDSNHTVALPKLDLYATSALLLDASNNRVLYEKNGYQVMPMASTTKIMTLIVTLENANLADTVTVSRYAATMPDVQLNINTGEQYKLEDLLYSLMLESHNDVAVAIAEHVGGSVEGFATMMNAKAKELGCENTNFVTPNGLDADGHCTTAVDLAKIASYAVKNKDFIKITNTPNYHFSELTKGRSFSVNNKDKFLHLYDGAIGIKTGFTGKAGYCFVGAVDKNNKTFISVVLACGWPPSKNYKWHDTTLLMDYGMNNFELKQLFNANKIFNSVYVKNGQESYVDLFYEGDLSLLVNENEKVKVIYKVPKLLEAPVMANTTVGNAEYYIGDDLIANFPILTSSSIEVIDFRFCLTIILDNWFIQ